MKTIHDITAKFRWIKVYVQINLMNISFHILDIIISIIIT